LGHERERGGVESQASICILGGAQSFERGRKKAEDA